MSEHESRNWDDYPDSAWERESCAVVACDGRGNGCVLWAAGPHVRFEIEEGGFFALDEMGLDEAPHGVSVWTGKIFYSDDDESTTNGAFRSPTDDEWQAIRSGVCPWDDADWRPER